MEKIKGQLLNSPASRDMGDVMIVGGGISGIQASLDLAASGIKVYQDEITPAIGGLKEQIEKTFTTNECSM